MLTLVDMLNASDVIEAKLASVQSAEERSTLQQKKACIDFTAFSLYKSAAPNFLNNMRRGLGWGAGLGIPLLGGGLLLEHSAKAKADDLLSNARNQALLASLGVGGASALNSMLQSSASSNPESFDLSKISADASLQKLAAHLLLDDVLVQQLSVLPEEEKQAAEACLMLNREEGADLLRKLLR